MSNIILLSYPRSGNTAVRYFLEKVTGFMSLGYIESTDMDQPIINKTHIDPNEVIIKSHGNMDTKWDFLDKPELKKQENKLIFLIRNPVECISRHLKLKTLTTDKVESYFIKNFYAYFESACRKTHVYYEDMINNPSHFYKHIANFCGADSNSVDDFLNNLGVNNSKSRAFYTKYQDNAIALGSGKDTNLHGKAFSKESKIEFLSFIRSKLKDKSYMLDRYSY
jgi:hypothetical protein